VGQNNKWLTGYFDNFQFSAANSDSTHLAFTGGTLKYYVQTAASNPFRNDLGSDNLDIANASLGTLWLDIAPVADATTGVTLVITLTGGGATTFLDSHAFALGDVIGGLAAPALDSNAINGHDILFTGQANRTIGGSCGPDFGVCGANNARALVIPEPITLSLFGAGLAGAAALRRRKVKKA
jgi:hypothetical protein